MTVSQLKELYLARQSCREFSAKPVAKEQLEEICALAGLSPSARNLQPWKVFAVTGKKLPAAIDCLKKRGKAPFVDNAAALLVVADETPASRGTDDPSYFSPYDVGEFTAHLVLAAETAGLASCILGWRDGGSLKEVLSLPEGIAVPYVVVLGYAADGYETRPKKRKPAHEILEFID